MVEGLPTQYIFFLRCCLSKECVHPLCSVLDQFPSWYEGGPPLSFIPLPVQDPKRLPGNLECPECKGVCNGHYLKPDNHLLNLRQCTQPVCMPPSDVIKTCEAKTDSQVEQLARDVLLSKEDVLIWANHLETVTRNRKQAAIKAAATRRKKKQDDTSVTLCGVCGKPWQEQTDKVENWIQCELCELWLHWECEGVEEELDSFVCRKYS